MKKYVLILAILNLVSSCKKASENEGSENHSKEGIISTEENAASVEAEKSSKEISELIQINTPKEGAVIESPLQLSGKAKGYWFFEADAPVKLLDEHGNLLAKTYIKATDDWMTRNWVNFEGNLEFEVRSQKSGYLVFERANPSGLEENENQYKFPVRFIQQDR